MIAIVVVAHVPLASALVACARHVLGHEPEVEVADILPNECASDCAPNLAQQLIAADQGEGVLVVEGGVAGDVDAVGAVVEDERGGAVGADADAGDRLFEGAHRDGVGICLRRG